MYNLDYFYKSGKFTNFLIQSKNLGRYRLTVRTPGSHPGNQSSILCSGKKEL